VVYYSREEKKGDNKQPVRTQEPSLKLD